MPRLTLTLDNGPDPELTPRVLDILAERSIRAVFFLIGEKVATPDGRALTRRLIEAGHLVGNHTMTHGTPLGLLTDAEVVAEIARADEALGELSSDPPLFRPGGGGGKLGPHLFSPAAVDYLLVHGHTAVTWNCVPSDWEETAEVWVPRARSAMDQLEHTVLVLHDVVDTTVERLGSFLDEVLDRGVQLTLDFPADCVVIAGGKVLPALRGLVSAGPSAGTGIAVRTSAIPPKRDR